MLKPVFVLLPGMDGTGRLFEPFTKLAKKIATCVVIKYPTNRVLARIDYLKLIEDALPITADFWNFIETAIENLIETD